MMHESRRSVDKRTCTALSVGIGGGGCLRTDMEEIERRQK